MLKEVETHQILVFIFFGGDESLQALAEELSSFFPTGVF